MRQCGNVEGASSNAQMRQCGNVESGSSAGAGFDIFALSISALRTKRARGTGDTPGGAIVAFVKEEAYKRLEDLQQRAGELGRYL